MSVSMYTWNYLCQKGASTYGSTDEYHVVHSVFCSHITTFYFFCTTLLDLQLNTAYAYNSPTTAALTVFTALPLVHLFNKDIATTNATDIRSAFYWIIVLQFDSGSQSLPVSATQ